MNIKNKLYTNFSYAAGGIGLLGLVAFATNGGGYEPDTKTAIIDCVFKEPNSVSLTQAQHFNENAFLSLPAYDGDIQDHIVYSSIGGGSGAFIAAQSALTHIMPLTLVGGVIGYGLSSHTRHDDSQIKQASLSSGGICVTTYDQSAPSL